MNDNLQTPTLPSPHAVTASPANLYAHASDPAIPMPAANMGYTSEAIPGKFSQHFQDSLNSVLFKQAGAILASSKLARKAATVLRTEFKQATVCLADKWTEQYRVMGEPFPGPWTFKYHPWLRDMIRSDANENVGQKAAQMGFTEAVLNRALFVVVQKKRDVLYILPAKTPDATDFSSGRFDPALEMSETLNDAFTSTKNVGLKRAGMNCLYVRGSRADNHIKSIPCSLIVLDEVEEMTDRAVSLAYQRKMGQNIFQIWLVSTPTVPNCGINKKFEISRQEHFMFACPSCSRHTELTYPECLVITADSETDPSIDGSHLICKECKAMLPNENKWEWLASGIWVPKFADRTIHGPHVNQLYSSAKACAPPELARIALRAQTNRADEQEFYNSCLGLPHIPDGSNVTRSHIESCMDSYRMGAVELCKGFLTLGIDVGSHCHFELTNWRFRQAVETTDINAEAVGRVVLAGTFSDFAEAHTLMMKFKPRMTVIDDMPETRTALAFARHYPGRVKLCHYSNGIGIREIIDHGERVTVDRTTWLDQALGRFMNQTIALPLDIPNIYKEHMTTLVRIYRDHRVTGEKIALYKSTGDDHYGHARNYSEIALKLAQTRGEHQNSKSRNF